MAIDYAFKIVEDETVNNVIKLHSTEGDNESNHPVLKQLKDRIQELENELAMREDTLLGVQEIVDKYWDVLPREYQEAMNNRFE